MTLTGKNARAQQREREVEKFLSPSNSEKREGTAGREER